MNSTICPGCQTSYTLKKPAKLLKNCDHTICERCLISCQGCPIDNVKIELRKYKLKAFPNNQEIMEVIKSEGSMIEPPKSLKGDTKARECQNSSRISKNQENNKENLETENRSSQLICSPMQKKKEREPSNLKPEVSNRSNTKNQIQARPEQESITKPVSTNSKQKSKSIAEKLESAEKAEKSQQKQKSKPKIKPKPKQPQNLRKTPQKQEKEQMAEPHQNLCLLHSKIADYVCLDDGQSICSSCGLFGQHKGHNILDSQIFVVNMGELAESTLELYEKVKEKEECLSEDIIQEYMENCFNKKRAQQVKMIKQFSTKIIEAVKKAEKSIIVRLDEEIKISKQKLTSEVKMQQLMGRTIQWYSEVDKLNDVMKEVFRMQNISQGFKYLDQTSQEGYILKKGEYLKLEYTSSQNVYKNMIDEETKQIQGKFDEDIFEKLDKFCRFGKDRSQTLKLDSTSRLSRYSSAKNFSTPVPVLHIQKQKEKSNDKQTTGELHSKVQERYQEEDEDILLDEEMDGENHFIPTSNLSLDSFDLGFSSVNNIREKFMASASSISPATNRVLNIESHCGSVNTSLKFTPSCTKREQNVLPPMNENKKKKRLEMPDKFKSIFEDLKKDKAEVVDFSGADFGDSNIISLCEYIAKAQKLKNLKLIRNRITDESIEFLIRACANSKQLVSLNLSHNHLTDKSLESFSKILGSCTSSLKNITLSCNKINKKTVKGRIEELSKRNIAVSV